MFSSWGRTDSSEKTAKSLNSTITQASRALRDAQVSLEQIGRSSVSVEDKFAHLNAAQRQGASLSRVFADLRAATISE